MRIRTRYGIGFAVTLTVILTLCILFRAELTAFYRLLISGRLSEDGTRAYFAAHFGLRQAAAISLMSCIQVLAPFFPAEPIQVLAGLAYGFAGGSAVAFVGVLAGNTAVFFLYRLLGERFTRYMGENLTVDLAAPATQRALAALVLFLYILPAIPYGMICIIAASSGMRFPRYILLTGLCSLPSILVDISIGTLAVQAGILSSAVVLLLLIAILIVASTRRQKLIACMNRVIERCNRPYRVRSGVQKPNPVVYSTAAALGGLWAKRNLRMTAVGELVRPEGQAVIVCNHPSFLDWLYVGRTMLPKKLNFVTARYYFYHRKLAWLLRRVGCIPKSMFDTDVDSAAGCLRVVRDGGSLALLPEARLSTAGTLEPVHLTTARFLKRLRQPVYYMKLDGAYLSKPKWGDGVRKGAPVELSTGQLLTAEELAALSPEEILERVRSALDYDDFAWLARHPEVRYDSPTLAVGLQNILYFCPHCGGEGSIETAGRRVRCSACGTEDALDDRYGFIESAFGFQNFSEWYRWQVDRVCLCVQKADFSLSTQATLRVPSRDGRTLFRTAGGGVCRIDRTGFSYRGDMDGVPFTLDVPDAADYRLLFGAGEDFELYHNRAFYYFVPPDTRACVLWYLASEALSELRAQNRRS